MARYNIDTTDDGEKLLTWITAQHNAVKDQTLTNQEYITLRFQQLMQPFFSVFAADTQVRVKDAYAVADPAVQLEVQTLLGLVTP